MSTFEPPRPGDAPRSAVPPPPPRPPSLVRPTLYDEGDPDVPDPLASSGRKWVVVLITLAVLVGGGLGFVLTRKDSDDAAGATSLSTVPLDTSSSTVQSTTTTVADVSTTESTVAPSTDPPTTLAPETTFAPGSNEVGVPLGQVADPASTNPAEHFVANLGSDDADAAPSTPAALYARWFRLLLGAPGSAVATQDGFLVTLLDGSTVELADFEFVAGKVSDMTHCPGDATAGACQRVSTSETLASLEPAGTSSSLDIRRLGDVRIGDPAVLFLVTASKPVAKVDVPGLRVGFDGTVLSVAGELPASTPADVLFADGTVESLTLTLTP